MEMPVLLLLLLCSSLVAVSKGIDCSALINGRDPRPVVPCLLSNPNATSCRSIGCCWNSNSKDPRMRCFSVKGGTCFVNPVPSCMTIVNTTLPAYRTTPRFIDNKLGIPITEIFLGEMIKIINEYANDDKTCQKILLTMVCHYTAPPCKPDGTTRPFCQEDCLAIFKKCKDSLNQAVGAAKYISQAKGIAFSHVNFPNCSNYKPSSQFDMNSNNSCIRTGFFDFDEKTEEKTNLLAIILPIFFILIIIIFVIVVFIVVRHRRKQNAMQNSKLMLSDGALTMREKLRADSLKSMDFIRLYDPSKMKHYPLDNVEYIKDLGEGHFGKVFQGRAVGILDKQPKKEIMVAVKALKEGSSKEMKTEFFQEVALMSIFQHPNIVSLIAVSTEEEPYGMIFEFMNEGDLNHYLRNAKPAEISVESTDAKVFLSQEDLISISEQIAAGMEEVAKLKFIHRDLATRNCLVGPNLVVKIADFGMSRDIYQSNYYKMSRETLLPIRWLAPEAFLYGKFTSKSDVYSYGVVLWEIYTFGLQPYYGYSNTEVTDFIKKGIHLGQPERCPNFVYAIMKDCWEKDPSDRPDFGVIQKRLRDPFGNYDVPKATADPGSPDTLDGKPVEFKETGSQDFGDYDVPKDHDEDHDMYDRPRSPGDVDHSRNYDIPKSPDEDHAMYDNPRSPVDLSENYDIPKSPVQEKDEPQYTEKVPEEEKILRKDEEEENPRGEKNKKEPRRKTSRNRRNDDTESPRKAKKERKTSKQEENTNTEASSAYKSQPSIEL